MTSYITAMRWHFQGSSYLRLLLMATFINDFGSGSVIPRVLRRRARCHSQLVPAQLFSLVLTVTVNAMACHPSNLSYSQVNVQLR